MAELQDDGISLDRILPDFVKLACQANAAEVGYVALLDAASGDLVVRGAYGTASDGLSEGARMPQGKGIAGWSVANRQTALVTDAAADPRFAFISENDLDFEPRDLLCVPLITGDTVIGVLTLFNKKGGSFTEEDATLLKSVGELAANAIESARRYMAERESRRRAQTISAFITAVTQSLDVNVVLGVLLEYLGQLVPYDKATAMLVEWDSRFVARAVRGENGTAIPDPDFPTTVNASAIPVLRELMEKREGRVVHDISADPAWAGYPCAYGGRSWMGIPLVASGRVIGMYTLSKSTPGFYREDALGHAELLAASAATAIQSAWLFEKVGEGRARLQSLTRQLVKIQESERRAISRELHDEAGQSLAALKVGMHLLGTKVGDPDALKAGIAVLQQQVEAVMLGLHRLAVHLRPAVLDQMGLSAALRQMVDGASLKKGVRVEFEDGRYGDARLPEFAETAIYRIAQEALNNALQHARPTRVSILLERRDGQVMILIEDNGIGFDPVIAMHGERLGLVGMRERAEMLGGSFIVESSEGNGTTVVAEVPDADPNSAG